MKLTDDASAKTPSSCRFTGAASSPINRLTNPALDPDQPDARVQGLRGAASRSGRDDATQRLVVIGNGMAGARLVEDLLARDGADRFDITIFGDEPHGNYNRILLSGVLAGQPPARRTSSSTRCRGTRRAA